MTLTPDTCITRARRCLSTGQPRMAQLYMRRALATLGQRWILPPHPAMTHGVDTDKAQT